MILLLWYFISCNLGFKIFLREAMPGYLISNNPRSAIMNLFRKAILLKLCTLLLCSIQSWKKLWGFLLEPLWTKKHLFESGSNNSPRCPCKKLGRFLKSFCRNGQKTPSGRNDGGQTDGMTDGQNDRHGLIHRANLQSGGFWQPFGEDHMERITNFIWKLCQSIALCKRINFDRIHASYRH